MPAARSSGPPPGVAGRRDPDVGHGALVRRGTGLLFVWATAKRSLRFQRDQRGRGGDGCGVARRQADGAGLAAGVLRVEWGPYNDRAAGAHCAACKMYSKTMYVQLQTAIDNCANCWLAKEVHDYCGTDDLRKFRQGCSRRKKRWFCRKPKDIQLSEDPTLRWLLGSLQRAVEQGVPSCCFVQCCGRSSDFSSVCFHLRLPFSAEEFTSAQHPQVP
eukprot:CAMPEP_0202839992 /NCGR_PEP_ID=MMETSP1389-20130828/54458_1 /ASSEMBLY_ACC=CAM_ASM_000865 /TAXON_ID=302021 /ORGANISM="Rhodomonas sp., Strain CCMP768" /LENGTH=215 /DNA_ID=CAMNT_0049516549 /DNA_START=168 /DNA_END=813 /DNA_ORIENTATION=-